MQLFISHLARWLRTRRFSEPTFRPSGATNHWKNIIVSRLSYLFAHLHLLSSDSFSSLIFSLLLFPSLTLPTSAVPSVHIVVSLTSKLPSIKGWSAFPQIVLLPVCGRVACFRFGAGLLVPLQRVAARCRCKVLLSECCLCFGAWLLVPQGVAARCCQSCQSAVCALGLGCWCHYTVVVQSAAVRVLWLCCRAWLVSLRAAAVRVLWLRFGACLLAPVDGAAACRCKVLLSGCCCQSAVCALELGCWCGCRFAAQGAAVGCCCEVPLQGAAAGCSCRVQRGPIDTSYQKGERLVAAAQRYLVLSEVYAGVIFCGITLQFHHHR